MKLWRIETGKCSINENNEVTDDIGVNTGDNYKGDKMTDNDEVVDNKVSNGVNYNDEYNN